MTRPQQYAVFYDDRIAGLPGDTPGLAIRRYMEPWFRWDWAEKQARGATVRRIVRIESEAV